MRFNLLTNPNAILLIQVTGLVAFFFSCEGSKEDPSILEIRDLLDSGHISESVEKAKSKLLKTGKTDQIHYLRGWMAYLRKDDPGAEKEYKLCLKENPISIDCLRGIAQIRNHRKEYEKAESSFKKALAVAEASKDREYTSMLMTDLGNLFLSQDIRKEALDWYSKSISIKEEGSAYYGMGLVYLLNRDKASSISYLKKGIDTEYRDLILKAETYYLLAKLQNDFEKNPKAAAESAKKAFELFPAMEKYSKSWEQYAKAARSK
ncbi:tetratricopeptide repeat protein [Leptospira semungkisensis]|uniref:Tetratricopeptide repeat protein n=1 Tax=Leptospira semungkisensis TaxID=2484985 RepID=A0A4R9G5M6_9LEPT|nr:tetratricopeptide repeat protein [Leptospira semungkisensis]TGK06842.1 tetratricopeptide repeat protein [Leptospira semungkisensis]